MLTSIFKFNSSIQALCLFFMGFLLFSCKAQDNHYIFAVDISGSMSQMKQSDSKSQLLFDEKPIEAVQDSLPKFLTLPDSGDIVDFMAFHSDIVIEENLQINTNKEALRQTVPQEYLRQDLIKKIANIKANGLYTDTKQLVSHINQNLLSFSEKSPPFRNVFAVIFSDGVDDPPPEYLIKKSANQKQKNLQKISKQQKMTHREISSLKDIPEWEILEDLDQSIKDRESQSKSSKHSSIYNAITNKIYTMFDGIYNFFSGKRSYTKFHVYYISLAKVEGNSVQIIRDSLSDISSESLVVEAPNSVYYKKAFTTVISKIKGQLRRDFFMSTLQRTLFLLLFACFTALVYYISFLWRNRYSFKGILTYRYYSDSSIMNKDLKLRKIRKPFLQIGPKLGAKIRIRDLQLSRNLQLAAWQSAIWPKPGSKSSDTYFLKISPLDIEFYKFMKQKKVDYISSGDIFQIGDYIFEYNNEE